MTYAEQLTAQLRSAHITALKQRYLDLIEEAKRTKEKSERQYFDDAKQAYIDKQQGMKRTPQQLSAFGISGGRGDEELASIVADYDETMAKLKRRRDEFMNEYEYTVQRQKRLMDNALNEYNARIAIEDYNASSRGGGSGSGKSASDAGNGDSGSSTDIPYISPELEEFMGNFGYRNSTNREKVKA